MHDCINKDTEASSTCVHQTVPSSQFSIARPLTTRDNPTSTRRVNAHRQSQRISRTYASCMPISLTSHSPNTLDNAIVKHQMRISVQATEQQPRLRFFKGQSLRSGVNKSVDLFQAMTSFSRRTHSRSLYLLTTKENCCQNKDRRQRICLCHHYVTQLAQEF